jgi:hypothetical protein
MPGLTELLHVYDQRNRSRSRGGLHAISGMAFQIYCYLADYAAILAERNPEEAEEGREESDDRPDPDLASFESLSDYLIKKTPVDYSREGDTVVCVQAKRTLNRETLSKAADEFVAIDRFLEAEAPGLRPSVRFEVIASRGQAAGAACWQAVTLSRHGLALDREDQARLDAMGREGRLLPPRIDPDPWWRLIGTVFHRLSDPFGFAYEATALCLERGLDPAGAERVRVDIARLFARLRRDGPLATGRVMRASDFRPLDLDRQSKEVNVGQIPTVLHLQDGRFMEREEQLATVLGSLDKVLDSRRVAVDPAVHSLWLGGASGSGKSVLLLHLMRELVVEREERVIWLCDASWDLLPFLESWRGKRTPHQESEPVFVLVDDFYAPVKRSELALPRVGNLVRHSGVADWPVLVTCGPSEQQLALESREGYCGLRFETWKLPLATPEERGRIRAWFTERTGQAPKEGSSSGEDQGLMVSMVFEMARGDLREFALRFKSRLETEHLDRAVLPVLALNRLYLEAPAGCLSEEQREALDRINRDDDFLVVTAGGTERLRLTHPHLSDEIYKVMRARDGGDACVRDLVNGFKAALREDPGVALEVLGLVVDAHEGWGKEERRERLALLPEDKLVAELARVWAADPGALERFGVEQKAWAWTLWSQLGQFHPEAAGHVPGAPARALAALREVPIRSGYWRAAWFRLLRVCSDNADEAPEQRSLAPGRRAQAPSLSTLLRLGFEWLREGEVSDKDWGMVWRELLKRRHVLAAAGLSVPDLLRQGHEWLMGHEDSDSWGGVWRGLLSHRDLAKAGLTVPDLLRQGHDWFKGHEDSDSWPDVWQAVLSHRDLAAIDLSVPDLLRQGHEWLKGHEDSDSWPDVWQAVLSHRDLAAIDLSVPDLLRQGHEWLKGHEDSNSWGGVWRGLLSHRDLAKAGLTVPDLLRQGHGWLKGHEDSRSWHDVWRDLLSRDDLAEIDLSVSDLLRQGHEWLKGREDSVWWHDVWRDLLSHRDLSEIDLSVPDLLRQGHEWLKRREDSYFWPDVWRDLLSHRDLSEIDLSVPDLLRQGHEWLKGHEDSYSWGGVWRDLLSHRDLAKAGLTVPDLLRQGHEWLKGHEDSDSWPDVWQAVLSHRDLAKAGLTVPDLLRQGHGWLKGHEDSRSWHDVWRDLLSRDDLAEIDLSVPDLLRQGHEWLMGHEDSYSWGGVWRDLLSHRDLSEIDLSVPDLLRQGHEWLKRREDSYSWPDVWRDLLSHRDLSEIDLSVPDLLRQGHEWLESHRDRASAGSVLIGLLDHQAELPANTSLPDLLHLGLQWLAADWAKDDFGYPSAWPTLFLAILPHLSSRPADLATLTDLARRWLAHPDSEDDPDRPAIEAALAAAEAASATDEPLTSS